MLEGIDVSVFQSEIDWGKVSAHASFAFVRVSDGARRADSRFSENWEGAGFAGVPRGPYQFFRASQSSQEQASVLVGALGGSLPVGALPPVLDVELSDGQPKSRIVEACLNWLGDVETALGVVPAIYTGPYFWQNFVGDCKDFARYPLWIAHYGVASPRVPLPWKKWTFWQYSGSGRVDGIRVPVDLDRFDGTREEMLELGRAVAPESESCDVGSQDRGL